MKTTAMIPLRGGSKGIPGKNIKPLCGKPLCYWALQAASNAESIHEVYVSTDCPSITAVVDSLNLGIKIIDRPKELATDDATTEAVVLHFAQEVNFDRLVTIQATSPLLLSKHLDEGMAKFEKESLDSLISTNRLKQYLWNEDGTPMNYDPLNRKRRQDFPGAIVENGCFYICNRETLTTYKCRFGEKVGFYDMPDECRLEIDDLVDFSIAELLLKKRQNSIQA